MQHYAIVAFPKIDVERIQAFRRKYDPLWNVILPHISPFADIPEQLILEHLGTVSKALKPFQIHLKDFVKSFDHYFFFWYKKVMEKYIKYMTIYILVYLLLS